MRKDIHIPAPKNVFIAIALENEIEHEWKAYILNLNPVVISNVMITSTGLSDNGNHTSVLRHFIEEIQPNTAIPFEIVTDELLQIDNNFFVTYYIENLIHDFDASFKANAYQLDSLKIIPIIQKRGVISNQNPPA
jgi:hypothetical protein